MDIRLQLLFTLEHGQYNEQKQDEILSENRQKKYHINNCIALV